jgi:signal peptidase II
MSSFKRNRLLGLGVAALTFAADQAVKWAVVHPIGLPAIYDRNISTATGTPPFPTCRSSLSSA